MGYKQKVLPIHTLVPGWLEGCLEGDDPTYTIKKKNLLYFLTFCKYHIGLQYKYYIDCTALDYPSNSQRFVVVYHLRSLRSQGCLRLKVFVQEGTCLASSIAIYPAANWYEREIWDMFGIKFTNHPDLRRLLGDYGFAGHPLRKDFPCSGYIEVSFNDGEKRVVSTGVEFAQENRSYENLKPWDKEFF